MLSLPFSLVGGLWLVWWMGFNMSVAVAVGFIALAGAPNRFLWAPADRLTEAPDVGRMVSNAKLEANDHGDPPAGPHVAPKPIGGRATLEGGG